MIFETQQCFHILSIPTTFELPWATRFSSEYESIVRLIRAERDRSSTLIRLPGEAIRG
ncbi:hypothetical protein RISK_006397 [Rhodopirellula islandica]|uniref:Uncharacterized protein n=1 Tax=Rhodopirellula islandica TaxID=595434 RepID=A0A0J1B3Y0_RHOIS|nr:hypothetical protein RISK_006397 [Rhodopirellula islandica]